MTFLDYSQYKAWMKCPWLWYEKYVNQMERRREDKGYKDDALTIGSLTHSGLENWGKNRQITIDQQVISELGPSPEALQLSKQLVQAYVARFPREEFQNERTEEPLLFELPGTHVAGLALIDNHFYNPELADIESGIADERFGLEPGWWIREYKTKDSKKNRAVYQQAWVPNMQADFQLHALRRKVGELPKGLFICVLEKPSIYIPHRKCKGCAELLELAAYLSTGDGFACPLCGHKQKLTPYVPKVERKPDVYRLAVTRTPEQLDASLIQIAQVAKQMDQMRQDPNSIAPNREACIVFNSVCDYLDNHMYFKDTRTDHTMVARDATRYVRLEQLRLS